MYHFQKCIYPHEQSEKYPNAAVTVVVFYPPSSNLVVKEAVKLKSSYQVLCAGRTLEAAEGYQWAKRNKWAAALVVAEAKIHTWEELGGALNRDTSTLRRF